MSESNLSWFHCGRCGSLFQSQAGDVASRLCPHCGFDPSPDFSAPTAASAAPADTAHAASHSGHRGKRSGKRKKRNHLMTKLICGWLLVLALIIVVSRMLWHQETATPEPLAADSNAPAVSPEDLDLLNKAAPDCIQTFSNYIAAGGPEQSTPFVLDSVAALSRMVRFYSQNPLTKLEPANLTVADSSILQLPGAKGVEIQWNSNDGLKLDTVFRKEDDAWKLDWDHFARFSDYPWALFLAGSGPSEGEFRLLARERLAEERKTADDISIVLYAPRFGHPDAPGFQSPEFLVPRDSPDGKLLDAAFQQMRRGERAFGSQLPRLDPDGMIRVRLKVRRIEEGDERRFELVNVAACHWLAVNDPGVKLPERGHSDR